MVSDEEVSILFVLVHFYPFVSGQPLIDLKNLRAY